MGFGFVKLFFFCRRKEVGFMLFCGLLKYFKGFLGWWKNPLKWASFIKVFSSLPLSLFIQHICLIIIYCKYFIKFCFQECKKDIDLPPPPPPPLRDKYIASLDVAFYFSLFHKHSFHCPITYFSAFEQVKWHKWIKFDGFEKQDLEITGKSCWQNLLSLWQLITPKQKLIFHEK